MYADQKAYEKWKEELETSCFNNHGDKCSQLAICYFYENKLKKRLMLELKKAVT